MNSSTSSLPSLISEEQLQADLAVLRDLAVAQRLRESDEASAASAAAAEERGEGGSETAEQQVAHSHAKPSNTSSTATIPSSPADPLHHLREELQRATASLHDERATVAQLRIQERCDDAAVRRLTEQVEAAEQQRAAAESECNEWRKRATAAEAQLGSCFESAQQVQKQVEALQGRSRQLEAAHRVVMNATAAAQHTITKLMAENAHLHEAAVRRAAELQRLAGMEVEWQAAQQCVRDTAAQHESWVAATKKIAAYFEAAQTDFEEAMRLVAARREDYHALQAALAQREAQCTRWERLFRQQGFAGTQQTSLTDAATIEDGTRGEEQSTDEALPTQESFFHADTDEREGNNAAFAQQLEAKVADLAVSLFAAQTRADTAEERLQHVSQLSLTDAAVVTELRAALSVLRPQAEVLAAHNAALQARLLTAEALTEPLMEHVMAVAEAYTAEVCRSWQSRAAARSGATGADSAQKESKPVETPSTLGTRHRLRATALLPRRGA